MTHRPHKIWISGDWHMGMEAVCADFPKEDYKIEKISMSDLQSRFQKDGCDLLILCVASALLPKSIPVLVEIKQTHDHLPVFVVSDSGDWESAVEVMKAGASEYMRVPFARDRFKKQVATHIRLYQMAKKVFLMEDASVLSSSFEGMIAKNPRMIENFRMIQAVAKSNATVLITGESGTGKELVAKAIHKCSNRAAYRFVDINCGAIPRELLENELFGHEKGAFTGAHRRYNGSFEVAHRGSLFLDEISEMDPLLQVKLLRVLQERSFMRIGGNEKIDVDVRIIAATNRNLEESIEQGAFREDLYYRLNVVNISVPPLRERREDIPLLAHHFLEFYSAKNDRIFLDFSNEAIEALINYDWPGNVRELENTIERVVVLHNDSQVKLKFLPKHVQRVSRAISFEEVGNQPQDDAARVLPLDDMERRAIEVALLKFQGNVSIAAKKLQIGQATLYRKIKKYGLEL